MTTSWGGQGWPRQWKRIRWTIMQRDGHLCQPCLSQGRVTPATEVDHITPRHKGGTEDADNLQSICRACHDDKTASDTGKRAKVSIGADGWPL